MMLSQRAVRGAVRPFTPSVRPPTGRAQLVVVALKPTKAADFRTLSDVELADKIHTLRLELANVRWLQATKGVEEILPGKQMEQPDASKVPKGHMNAHIRRQVAQVWTLLRERTMKDGVSRRQYAKMMKKAAMKSGLGSPIH